MKPHSMIICHASVVIDGRLQSHSLLLPFSYLHMHAVLHL